MLLLVPAAEATSCLDRHFPDDGIGLVALAFSWFLICPLAAAHVRLIQYYDLVWRLFFGEWPELVLGGYAELSAEQGARDQVTARMLASPATVEADGVGEPAIAGRRGKGTDRQAIPGYLCQRGDASQILQAEPDLDTVTRHCVPVTEQEVFLAAMD